MRAICPLLCLLPLGCAAGGDPLLVVQLVTDHCAAGGADVACVPADFDAVSVGLDGAMPVETSARGAVFRTLVVGSGVVPRPVTVWSVPIAPGAHTLQLELRLEGRDVRGARAERAFDVRRFAGAYVVRVAVAKHPSGCTRCGPCFAPVDEGSTTLYFPLRPDAEACDCATNEDCVMAGADPCAVPRCEQERCITTPAAAGVVCRPAAGRCDREELCTGSRASCPPDEQLAVGALCTALTNAGERSGFCRRVETALVCDTTCRPGEPCVVALASASCVEGETVCSEDGVECALRDGTARPAPATRVCAQGTGTVCNPARSCDGSGFACPPLPGAETPCPLPPTGDAECTARAGCDGNGRCVLTPVPDGTRCTGADAGNPCLRGTCVGGACVDVPLPDGDACSLSASNRSGFCRTMGAATLCDTTCVPGAACALDAGQCRRGVTRCTVNGPVCDPPAGGPAPRARGEVCDNGAGTECRPPRLCDGVSLDCPALPVGACVPPPGADAACVSYACDGAGSCSARPRPNGTECGAASACVRSQTCSNGACVRALATAGTSCSLSRSEPCVVGRCTATGVCAAVPVDDRTACGPVVAYPRCDPMRCVGGQCIAKNDFGYCDVCGGDKDCDKNGLCVPGNSPLPDGQRCVCPSEQRGLCRVGRCQECQ